MINLVLPKKNLNLSIQNVRSNQLPPNQQRIVCQKIDLYFSMSIFFFSQQVPSVVLKISSLEVQDLSRNMISIFFFFFFSQQVPSVVLQRSSLEVLDLSRNMIHFLSEESQQALDHLASLHPFTLKLQGNCS